MIEAKILKSPCTPRPKKEKQEIVPDRVSPRNLLLTKLSMGEKGKSITRETDEEEEDLEGLVITEDKDEGMEEETEPAHPLKKLPTYSPHRKGRLEYPRTFTI